MKLTDLFLADLEREVPASRRVLERVPDGSYDWKPHPKSMQMGYLSTLVATMPSWIDTMVNQDELDFAPKGGSTYKAPELRTDAQLVQALEESVEKARAALKGTTDEHLLTSWRLLAGGHVVAEMPRHIQIRDGVLNHWAHHRGQLTVYLRLNDVPVPSVYGPSADEGLGSR
jgi:uncharacterized damage-inducible protein DinB